MAHPYIHSLSSCKKFGGQPQDYLFIHHWFDETKKCYAHFTHRALRHHTEGINMAIKKFGLSIINSNNTQVPVGEICSQHLIEDCNIIPTPHDWIANTDNVSLFKNIPPKEKTIEYILSTFKPDSDFTINNLSNIVHFFYEPAAWSNSNAWPIFRCHSEGIFTAEEFIGVFIQNNNKPIPVRLIAEKTVSFMLKNIPSPNLLLRYIKPQKWMLHTQKLHPTK